jgi:hypothetical protein
MLALVTAVHRDSGKNMIHGEIAVAIRRLETSGVTIVGGFHGLMHWC